MSLNILRVRIRALLLFFVDYKAILYCFTILALSIPSSSLLESLLFYKESFSFDLLFKISIPSLILILFFTVSYRAICYVHIFRTILKIFLVSTVLVALNFFSLFSKIESQDQKVSSFTEENVHITGVLISQEKSSTYLFDSGSNSLGKSLARFNGYTVLHSGQRCKLSAKVVQPKSFEEFDYRKYLFRKGIYSILEVEDYECFNGGNIFLELRYMLEKVVERSIDEPEASLLIGIMFGSKRIFKEDFNKALNSSGVSHIISASGYNVALVAQAVDRVGRGSNSRLLIFLKILSIWSFSIFSGLSSSLVRAASMTTISLFALLFRKESNKAFCLILCATVLLFFNPFLIHDVGFLFSFASVVGLIFLPKCFEGIKSKYIKEGVLTTLTCILFTLPISVIFFKKVSIISLLSNIIVIPIINSTIFWGLGVTLINIFFPIKVLYLIPYLQLKIFKYLVQISSNIDMVEININGFLFGISVYLSLFLFCLLKYPVSSKNYYLKLSQRYE